MSKFMLTIGINTVAGQIADLLNSGHQLWYRQNTFSITRNRVKYIIELYGDQVVGVIGMEHIGNVTELKHLCVHPDYRGQGIGKKMLRKGIEYAPTPIVFGQVRSDNQININNNLRLGMIPIGKKRMNGYSIIVFSRRKNCDSKTIQH